MYKNSILVKLNILFSIAIIATIVAAFSLALHIVRSDTAEIMFKSRLIYNKIRHTEEIPYGLIREFHLKEIKGAKKQEVLERGKWIHKRAKSKKTRSMHRRVVAKHRKIIAYKGYRYLWIQFSKNNTILLEDKESFLERFAVPLWVFFGVISLLLMMYVLLRKSLLPLKRLQKDIVLYGEGELKEYHYTNKQDEVSQASNAFYASVEKVQQLKKSRQLMIRNLFHELNTPIAKGKIFTELVEDAKTKTILDSIFTRLSMLLKELAQMEQISAKSYTMNLKSIPIRELIDEASDLLYLEGEIQSNVISQKIVADFSSMRIVFKNLIDNALKYGENLEIIVDDLGIHFVSEGEPLKEQLSYYTQAFSKGEEQGEHRGFGLGLYIVNEILEKNNMQLNYSYENGKNSFTIKDKNNL
jgi:two-component system OmpR family sensor kinase